MGGDAGCGLGAGDFVGLAVAVGTDSDGGSIDMGGALAVRSGGMGDDASGSASVSTTFALAAWSVASSTGRGMDESSR